jgi:hypothetical protein
LHLRPRICSRRVFQAFLSGAQASHFVKRQPADLGVDPLAEMVAAKLRFLARIALGERCLAAQELPKSARRRYSGWPSPSSPRRTDRRRARLEDDRERRRIVDTPVEDCFRLLIKLGPDRLS